MDTPFDEIAADAMKLSPRDRVRLAQRLVSSLDDQVEDGVEALWMAEAERRLEERGVRCGHTIPAKGVEVAGEEIRRVERLTRKPLPRLAATHRHTAASFWFPPTRL